MYIGPMIFGRGKEEQMSFVGGSAIRFVQIEPALAGSRLLFRSLPMGQAEGGNFGFLLFYFC